MKKLAIILFALTLGSMAHATVFAIYAPGYTNYIETAFQDGQEAALTLPVAIPGDTMYMLWPTNSAGYGEPIFINKTELWWVGPDQVESNGTFSAYGRNLSLGGGDTFLYYTNATASGMLTNYAGNPYKADFAVGGLTPGTYTVYAHNGHGKELGWSDGLTLTVEVPVPWNSTTNSVATYGANGDGSDEYAEIDAAIDDCSSYDTLYFPAGTYAVSLPLFRFNTTPIRVVGDGMDSTIIQAHSSFGGVNPYLVYDDLSNMEFHGIEFSCSTIDLVNIMQMRNGSNIKFYDCRFTQADHPVHTQSGDAAVNADGADYLFFYNCEFIEKDGVNVDNGTHTYFSNCTFVGIYDANELINGNGAEFSLIDSVAYPQDTSNTNDGAGWCLGRWVTLSGEPGGCRNIYIGDNSTTNMCNRGTGGVDDNSGEQVNLESLETLWRESVSSATSNTATFASLSTDYSDSLIVIISGTGVGQFREISGWDSGSKRVTVDQNWNVTPDSTSVAMIGEYAYRAVVYNNYFEGRQYGVDKLSDVGSTGVDVYGGASDVVIAENTFSTIRSAIEAWSILQRDDTPYELQPNFFNYYIGNTVTNCRYGLEYRMSNFAEKSHRTDDPGFMGSITRGNTYQGTVESIVSYTSWETDFNFGFNVFADNTATGGEEGIQLDGDRRTYYPWATDSCTISNQVFIGNTFSSIPTNIYMTTDSVIYLRDHTTDGINTGDTNGIIEL